MASPGEQFGRLRDDVVIVWRCPVCQQAHETPIVVAADGHRYGDDEYIELRCWQDKPGWPVWNRLSVRLMHSWALMDHASKDHNEQFFFALARGKERGKEQGNGG